MSEQPIEETINAALLTDVQVLLNYEEWSEFELGEDGVLVHFPSTLSKGVYNIELTAKYGGIAIRAAYFQCLSIVSWSYQSDAENYIPTSPLVADAAFVISVNGDEELTALKEQYRNAIAATEAEKAEYARKVAELNDVAQQSTSLQIKDKLDNLNVDVDLSDVAKQGDNQEATMTKVSQDVDLLPNKLIKALEEKYTFPVSYDGIVSSTPITSFLEGVLNKTSITEISDDKVTEVRTNWSSLGFTNCKKVRLKNCLKLTNSCFMGANIDELTMDNFTTAGYSVFRQSGLKKLEIPMISANGYGGTTSSGVCFMENPNLIDIVAGYNWDKNVTAFVSQGTSCTPEMSWYPTNAVTDASNLVEDKIDEFGRVIDTNKKQFLFNIRRHIAANMKQLTTEGYTIIFSTMIKEAILSDPMTADAFTNKGWTIA